MNQEIRVKLAEIIFQNEDNGYTVAVGETDDLQCTVVGTLPAAVKGRIFALRGKWKVHPTYGEQFAFTEYEEIMPETTDGIVDFLASGVLKGVGPKMAHAIVSHFGDSTLSVIEESPDRLTEVAGIGPKKAQAIAEAFAIHREFAEVSLFLQRFDISPAYAMKLYHRYGAMTLQLLKENPYQMIADIRGIGFKKADAIAAKLGIDKNDSFRIESGIKYMLSYYVSEGHTYAEKATLLENTANLLEVSWELIEDALTKLTFDGSIQMEVLEGQEVVYLMPYYKAERNVCAKLAYIADARPKMIDIDMDAMISVMEAKRGIELSEKQKRAITAAVANSVCIITGGPGTGKTTIINAIIDGMTKGGLNVAIAAPTGRAAKRITETSGYYASTIHRLLEYAYSEEEEFLKFERNAENPLDYDAVIIDEASMIDLLLMNALVNAIKPGTRLVLVGDADQLPSVGAGNVLRDLIDSEFLYAEKLTEIFRQAGTSMIVVNAHNINRGEYPQCNTRDSDFFLMRCENENMILATIKDLVVRRLPAYYEGIEPRDIQVLTPVRKRTLGCINLNAELQAVINPPNPKLKEKQFGGRLLREGDKVMQIKNNYQIGWRRVRDFSEGEGVFNGDMGVISTIDEETNRITVIFDEDRFVTYDYTNIDEIELAYAVTVHKSQGSEFPIVVMPISWFPPMLATRNLLYTAVTRGKQVVVLVGSEEKLNAMVDNNRIMSRNSGLRARLQALRG